MIQFLYSSELKKRTGCRALAGDVKVNEDTLKLVILLKICTVAIE